MKRETTVFLFLTMAGFCCSCFAPNGQAADSSQTQTQSNGDAVTRGKQIYLRGTSASGNKITAYLPAPDNMVVPGNIMECATCHGPDGRGKAVGDVTPPILNWEALTKGDPITHPDGRKHPPYTEALLKRAITMGVDPAGNQLSKVMPRYRMSAEDLEDLILYLKRLGNDPDQAK